MSGEKENHYKTLEVSETATSEEIKKAYRKLSLKYHPDRNQGNSESVKQFQKINEAYEILGDIGKKNQYDMMNKNPFMRMNNMGGDGGDGIEEMLANLFFGGGMPSPFGNMMHGQEHMMGGNMGGMSMPSIRIFRNGVQHQMEKPVPIIKTIYINMEMVLTGGKVPLEIERWLIENGNKIFETTTLYVDIFKGIDHNEIIILKDQGNIINENSKGDVKIFISINNDSEFTRRGLDLIMNKNISLKESLCGFSFDLKYINGKVYTINNGSGNIIPPEYQKIIPNMGLTRENHTGNMLIHFHVIFPETLAPDKILLISEAL